MTTSSHEPLLQSLPENLKEHLETVTPTSPSFPPPQTEPGLGKRLRAIQFCTRAWLLPHSPSGIILYLGDCVLHPLLMSLLLNHLRLQQLKFTGTYLQLSGTVTVFEKQMQLGCSNLLKRHKFQKELGFHGRRVT